ncbi:LCP family protein [Mobilitalea sibirica]|uniref:LCP family protein n=1 Tax=Mobilitalea sibirica TaxID=1462919 RepID=A0A8J7KUB2_9FIRM|nr:LCP family protein [Mobilitalea sibirica]MBH1942291.1 LCP family protein [Mobilitalea sibirica]
MRENTKKRNVKRLIIISISSFLGIAFILGATAYFVVRSYIGKMNLVVLEEDEMEYVDSNEYVEDDEYVEDNYYDAYMDKTVDEIISMDTSGSNDAHNKVINETQTEDVEDMEEQISRNMSDNRMEIKKDKDVLNVLLIGSDSRNSKRRGLSDAMILISINKKTKTIFATSFLRDIYLQIPGKKNNRLNTAYSSGGAKLLMETIEQNFKIDIDKYISVDFFAFMDIVDAIGGVTLEITDKELPVVNDYVDHLNKLLKVEEGTDRLKNSGSQLLNGKQALGYTRVRYVGTDFARTARQRKILEIIFNKIKGLSLTQMNDLLNKVLPKVTTNFKEGEIFSQIMSLPSYLKYDIEQCTIPIKDSYKNMSIRGMAVLGVDFEMNIKKLHERIYLAD